MTRLLICLAVLTAGAAPVAAHPVSPRAPYVVHIEDEHGRTLRTFHHQGQTFVLGSYGQRYNIRVRNQTGRRVEAVVTVDGRDVISGRVGDYVDERGYILSPYGDVLIEGFRTSEATVAAFRFTNPGNSYSSRMGTPQNVGVIGVAMFEERARPPRPRRPTLPTPYSRSHGDHAKRSRAGSSGLADLGSSASDAESAPSAPAAESRGSLEGMQRQSSRSRRAAESDGYAASRPEPRNNLGTEYGETTASHVRSTHFVRARRSDPSELIVLRYDDESGLAARGIAVYPREPRAFAGPSPFPRNRFAPPPP